jgi:5-dehydro-4-deoxyglucarate dehydratase
VRLRDLVPGYAVSLIKAGLALEGLPVGSVRPPLIDAAPAHVETLAQIIAAGRAALLSAEAVDAS